MARRASGLTRSREDYVKALFDLGDPDRADAVAVSALARTLGVSAPSVTNMLAHLEEEGLVALGHRGAARLTAAGEREALRMVRRHRILETFLVRVLGLDWSDVHEDAEVLEHHVSERVLEAIDRHMQHPREDPHGHLIPDRRGRLAQRRLLPLSGLASGDLAVVREIPDRDHRRMARWKQAGLVPGAEVRVRGADDADGVLELEIAGRRLVVASPSLEGVRVERRRASARP